MTIYQISEVAAQTGFATSTLRYYERIGVLAAASRSPAGYRLYDDRAIERLRFVARAKQLGLGLEEITELTRLWDGDQCAPVQDRLCELVDQKTRQVAEQIGELRTFAAQLADVRSKLTATPATGGCNEACGCVADVELSARSTSQLTASTASRC